MRKSLIKCVIFSAIGFVASLVAIFAFVGARFEEYGLATSLIAIGSLLSIISCLITTAICHGLLITEKGRANQKSETSQKEND